MTFLKPTDWETFILIAGMMPLGFAVEKTKTVQILADGMIGLRYAPLVIMSGLFILAALTSRFMIILHLLVC